MTKDNEACKPSDSGVIRSAHKGGSAANQTALGKSHSTKIWKSFSSLPHFLQAFSIFVVKDPALKPVVKEFRRSLQVNAFNLGGILSSFQVLVRIAKAEGEICLGPLGGRERSMWEARKLYASFSGAVPTGRGHPAQFIRIRRKKFWDLENVICSTLIEN